MKGILKNASLAVCILLALTLFSCSNGGDDSAVIFGGGTTPSPVSEGGTTQTGGGQSQNPVTKYTVTISSGITNGEVISDKTSATQGETVTLLITPSEGYEFNSLSVTASDGSTVAISGTGNKRTFKMPARNMTVNATFKALPVIVNYTYMTLGLWPQTIKADSVTIYENVTNTVGMFTYCKGSDGEWYAKVKENGVSWIESEYSDGTLVSNRDGNSYKWFKVEPIKWRVLTTDYNGTGKKLLHADKTLTVCDYSDCYDSNSSFNRYIDGKSITSSNYEHSRVRAFLNGISYQKKVTFGGEQTDCDDFLGKGFLQTAFTAAELVKIADTSVDNSARSTNPDGDAYAKLWSDGNNRHASDTPATDKVFLLSVQEATMSEYGFAAFDASGEYSARIRLATDYALAETGGYRKTSWGLRSPCYRNDKVRNVERNGDITDDINKIYTVRSKGGIVPALCLEN